MEDYDILFVLNGWHNGDEEMGKAQEAGPPDAPVLKDGWYWLDADSEPQGPFETRQKALKAAEIADMADSAGDCR